MKITVVSTAVLGKESVFRLDFEAHPGHGEKRRFESNPYDKGQVPRQPALFRFSVTA